MSAPDKPHLAEVARRASTDPFFLGALLMDYQALDGIDEAELAQRLQCPATSLARLALCRSPDEESAAFAQDVRQIAAFCGCNADKLLEIIRDVSAMRALRRAEGSPGGLLIAARDRQDEGRSRSPKAQPRVRPRRRP